MLNINLTKEDKQTIAIFIVIIVAFIVIWVCTGM